MKKFTSFLMAIVMCLTLVFTLALSGCNFTDGGNDSSSDGGGTSTPPVEQKEPQKIDRSEYTVAALQSAVEAYTVNDLLFDGKKAFKGYMVGDVFNSMLETLAENIRNGSIDVGVNGKALAKQFAYFEYDYYDDGWHAKKDDSKVHAVLNALLSYKLDGSEKLKLSSDMIELYKNETLLYIAGYDGDPIYNLLISFMDESGIIDTLMHAKVGDIVKVFSDDNQQVLEGVNAIVGEITIEQVSVLLNFDFGETVPDFATRLSEKKLSEVFSFMSKTDEEKVEELKVIFKDTTVGEVADFFDVKVAEDNVKALTVESALDDYLTFKKDKYEKKVEFVEYLLGDKTVGDLLTKLSLPIKADLNKDNKLKDLSKEASTSADGDFIEYINNLFNAVYSYIDTDSEDYSFNKILSYVVIPDVTVSDIIDSFSSKDTFTPMVYKFYVHFGGTELDEASFASKLDETFYPSVDKITGIFNEEKLIGDYTIVGLIKALSKEETRADAQKALNDLAEKLKEDVYASEWFAKLTSLLSKVENEIQDFAKANIYCITIPVGDDSFTIGDAVAYLEALTNNSVPDAENSLYKILDKITVEDAATAVKNLLDKYKNSENDGDSEAEIEKNAA